MEKGPRLKKGDSVGPYRIEASLGEGGMGEVYRADGPDGQVALKLLKPELAKDQQLRRRFDREVRAAKRIEDDHVVRVLDSGEHGDTPYLAQVLIGGGSLAEKIEREGEIGIERSVKITLHVAAGLQAMHKAGMVHRDLKPANILLDEDGRAYVADFGLVKQSGESVLTRPGQALGSVDYMAPEQIRGDDVTAAADVYSLGCVLFELIAGQAPFADREGMRVMWAHLQDEPRDPCADRKDVPENLSWTIQTALAKEPEGRPQTPVAYARMVQMAAGIPSLSPEGDS